MSTLNNKEPNRSTLQTDVMYALQQKEVHLHKRASSLIETLYNYTDLRKGGGVLHVKNCNTNHLYIVCTAGLGNRISTLIGGIYWANILNYSYSIVWDSSTCCICPYSVLFKNSDKILSRYTFCNQLAEHLKTCTDICVSEACKVEPHVLEKGGVFVYNSALLPSYISQDSIKDILLGLVVSSDIIDKANSFIEKNGIDKNVTGLHVRKIDPPEMRTNRFFIPTDFYLQIVKNNPDKKYFICSDSKEIEDSFKTYPNVLLYSKDTYPTYNSNSDITYRSFLSVVEAFVDILILSRTTIFNTSIQMSSFCQVANYYSNISLKP